jgi:hypothetical protein
MVRGYNLSVICTENTGPAVKQKPPDFETGAIPGGWLALAAAVAPHAMQGLKVLATIRRAGSAVRRRFSFLLG